MNSLQSGNNELVSVDYSDLLDKILQVLKNPQHQNLFKISPDKQRLLIDINSVTNQVINLQINSPLGASSNSAKTATVNFSPGFAEKFPKQIQEIEACLQHLLASQVEQHSLSIQQLVESLTTDLQDFKGNSSKLDFTYPFRDYKNLQKQRLTVSRKSEKGKELLRFHKLTINVGKTKEFNEQLRAGLEKFIKAEFGYESETEREDLAEILDDLYQDKDKSESDFYKLRQIIDRETLGKLKKQAQINYLEFLSENLNLESGNNAQAAVYLQDTIRRLRLVDEYINDINKADGDYLVNYAGVDINYRDIFSRAEAFDMLPIIPKVEGYLGETKDEDKGEIQFIFGLKLKFDGKVQAYDGKNVFEYYLNLLNPDSKEHKEELNDAFKKKTFARKVLKIVFIYYLMFAYVPNPRGASDSNWELKYNPIPGFDSSIMPILKGDDDEAKKQLFRKIINGFKKHNIYNKVKVLKQSLTNLIQSKRNFPTREYPLHISVGKPILEKDIDEILKSNTFFKPVLRGNAKQLLKYIYVGKADTKTNTLCSLPAKISISDIHYASSDEKQSFNMEYDIENIRALPILFLPFEDSKCQNEYNKSLKQRKLILFPYRLEDSKLPSHQLFVYNFAFSLLSYISLKVLLKKQKPLFIPILRLHLHNKDEDAPIEKSIVSLSKSLSHLLNEEHRSNAQGVDIRNLATYKLQNVFSSLYSILPKKFTFSNSSEFSKEVNRLAIIVISSRESDRSWGSSQKKSNVMGEILGFTCQNGVVKVKLINTFSDNYTQQEIFSHPTVIIDEVAKLYNEKKYRRFIYIAKAPYTSSLYMTQKEEDDGLFFMSKEVIRALKAKHDNIKIYPMFFDKYYASKFPGNIGVNSLYIKDSVELSNIVDDPNKKSVVFFNLFNGITIGRDAERNYNGVISYATFSNIYEGILDNEDIYKGLIFNGNLKNEILNLLTLFHFSRYEKAKNISLKLNPYENLIGDESVGALSLFNHMRGRCLFNLLAFLTEVKKILNIKKPDLQENISS